MLEPRYGPIQSIYILLRHADTTALHAVHAIRTVRIYNDHYGSDILTAFKDAKGYARPVDSYVPPVPFEKELLRLILIKF